MYVVAYAPPPQFPKILAYVSLPLSYTSLLLDAQLINFRQFFQIASAMCMVLLMAVHSKVNLTFEVRIATVISWPVLTSSALSLQGVVSSGGFL